MGGGTRVLLLRLAHRTAQHSTASRSPPARLPCILPRRAEWFKSHGGSQASIDRMWDPIGARAAGASWAVAILPQHRRRSAAEQRPAAAQPSATVASHSQLTRPALPTPNSFYPAAYALGFLNCDDISARCMLSIFQFFATKTDASALRMLNGALVPAG